MTTATADRPEPKPPIGWHTRGDPGGHCRSCHAPINWFENDRTGRMAPFDLDNTPHFATCPQAPEWRRRRKATTDGNGTGDTNT